MIGAGTAWPCALAILAGCAGTMGASVQYDSGSDRTTYTARRSVLGHRDMSAGLVSGQRVFWQAEAACAGEACVPEEVSLVFFNDSSSDLNLDYRRLQIDIDGRQSSWADLASEDVIIFAVPRGEFLRVHISGEYFLQLAAAQSVRVYFGLTASAEFAVPFGRREAFRDLAIAAGLTRNGT